ncbi:hypothetical protein FLAG1_08864 [Fusarium langsethiae]|uniref:Uncharacterized protein n=1 Tax=Fusarium langsethiae TaxID=179993 RepID=A0A0M9ERC2_FUSLA|nr:hypothetical protein FLAG1_08864 [Fusarium langsethiae]GKU08329.1 unnamed protein product [Fusarium langsethiae]GKU22874.1 unnamed protein product [Fusarium langsethiae]
MSSLGQIDRANDLTQTSPIPLTTVFTPKDGCTAQTAYSSAEWSNNQMAYFLDKDGLISSCYPSGYKSLQRDSNLWYSPGVCPHEYNYAATTISSYTDAPATTFAICCPSGISTVYGTEPVCFQVLTTGVQGAISFENSHINTEPTTTAYAAAISVAWQESDLSLFLPKSAPRLALQRAGVTLPPDPYTESRTASEYTSESTGSNSKTQNQDGGTGSGGGGGLSTGAIAGIGVGAAIAGIMSIALLWWFAKRFKVSRRDENIVEAGDPSVQQVYKVPDATTRPVEVGGTPMIELPS